MQKITQKFEYFKILSELSDARYRDRIQKTRNLHTFVSYLLATFNFQKRSLTVMYIPSKLYVTLVTVVT